MIRLLYYAPFAKPTGYAQAAHEYLMALAQLPASRLELRIRPLMECDTDDLDEVYKSLASYVDESGDLSWPTHVLVHTIPRHAHEFVTGDLAPPAGVKKVAMTTWETQKFPELETNLLLSTFDGVMTPSKWNQELIEAAWTELGVFANKVTGRDASLTPCPRNFVVPHCHEPKDWLLKNAPPAPAPFTFLNIGTWSERKNPIGLLKAYFHAFRKADEVLLRLVVPKTFQDLALADIEALARGMGMPDYPRVELLTGRMTQADVRNLHYASHCYVTATRGEAWGLGSFEAAVVGNPVIAPEGTGHDHYLRDYSGWRRIASQMTPAVQNEHQTGDAIDIGGVSFKPVKTIAPTGIRGDQFWLEPDLAQLARVMGVEFSHRLGARYPGRFDKFTRDAVGSRLAALLEKI